MNGAETTDRVLTACEVELPGVTIDREVLDAALRALPNVDDARGVEVALALACGAQDPRALRILEDRYLGALPRAIAHMKLSPALVDDVLQEVRRKLLVGDPPKIVEYAGKGSLRGLLRVTATRTAISMIRKTKRIDVGDDPVIDPEASHDFEASFLKAEYRGAFRSAFETAIGDLDGHERNLLRLHFLGRVTLEKLATMYGVHRATIVRRLAKIREELAKQTHAGLREALAITEPELESVMDLIRSRMDVSVERMLQTQETSVSET
ncbi:MAG: sigma-70 family RNA polymerase sigma factor [Myxococcota bacterium]